MLILRDFFEELGTVDSAKILFDRETRKSRGLGFVEMPDDDVAREAIAAIVGGSVDGRPLKVSEVRPREQCPKPSYGSNSRRGRLLYFIFEKAEFIPAFVWPYIVVVLLVYDL